MRRVAAARAAAIAVCLATVTPVLLMAFVAPASSAPTLDDQVYAIAGELMCPVCAGQTVAESNSALAVQMREIIRERLQAGQGRDEIIAYFVAQFGDGVLAAPRPRGSGLIVWLVPPAMLAIGIAIVRRLVSRRHKTTRPHVPPPTPEEADQIARELRELD